MSAIFKFILQGILCLLASAEVGFGAPASKIMEPSSGNVTLVQTPEKNASDSAITRIAFLGDQLNYVAVAQVAFYVTDEGSFS